MGETSNGGTKQVEGLLRRWGAEEASRMASGRAPPAPRMAVPAPAPVWPWWVLSAAAALVLAAAVLFAASRYGLGPADSKAAEARLAALAEELAAVRGELAKARGDLAEVERASADRQARFGSDLERVRLAAEARVTACIEEAGRRTAELKAALADQQALLERLASALKEAGEREAKDREALAAIEREREALRAEVARQAGALSDLSAASARTAEQLKEIHDRYADLERDVATLRLAAAVAETGGVEAIQAAAREMQLVGRSAVLRPRVRGGEALRLLDALEVVLTRLDLLDAGRADQVQSLEGLLRRGRVLDRLEQVLAAGEEDAEVRVWFLEVRLLLGRMERVG